ncbi:formate dehydrogenase subunit gamma [Lentilitoribacter sp. Alg239-R112]|jgi:formate dehydrogenase subunit gamma|uniref:formate dehydrogenase subunit gamma n=1 Tax=Lentilitoribacter sp. Alg239-R112 TaxID=2305987 RepID=UPI0013A68D0A|nr:formate dehydrogenase subunit gamma [Lentilitoribacter sp. Alg239-R112]
MSLGIITDEIEAVTSDIIDKLQSLEGPMLPILNGIQETFGYIPKDSLAVIADKLNLSKAEVHGVVSFYHDYRTEPAGKHIVKICRAEACQSMGINELSDKLLSLLGLKWGETSNDGNVTVEATYCLGLCACAPAAMVDGKLVARLDNAKIEALAAEILS